MSLISHWRLEGKLHQRILADRLKDWLIYLYMVSFMLSTVLVTGDSKRNNDFLSLKRLASAVQWHGIMCNIVKLNRSLKWLVSRAVGIGKQHKTLVSTQTLEAGCQRANATSSTYRLCNFGQDIQLLFACFLIYKMDMNLPDRTSLRIKSLNICKVLGI